MNILAYVKVIVSMATGEKNAIKPVLATVKELAIIKQVSVLNVIGDSGVKLVIIDVLPIVKVNPVLLKEIVLIVSGVIGEINVFKHVLLIV
jgi:hypothetical protein